MSVMLCSTQTYTRDRLLHLDVFVYIIYRLLLSKCEKDQVLLIIHTNPNLDRTCNLSLKFSKIISSFIFGTLSFYLFYIAVALAACSYVLPCFKFGATRA